MNCEKASELILEGSCEGAELKAHLLKCQRCASLARQWSALAPLRPAPCDPPTALDLKICTAAAETVQAARSRRLFVRIASGIGAAAAIAALTVSMSIFMPYSRNGSAASQQGVIAWDTVSIIDDLISLNAEIDGAKAALGSLNRREPLYSKPDHDSSMQLVSVEVPDFLT